MIHIGVDADTLEVRAVGMTRNRIGDAPVLPDLLAQIPAEERIGSVTADGMYDTKGCHAAIANRMTYRIYSAGISDEQKREIVERVGLPPCH